MADYVRTKQYVNGDVADGPDVGYEFDALGANVNLRLHSNGSVDLLAEQTIHCANPTLVLEGTESSGEDWRIREAAGLLLIQSYNGATWDTIVSLPFVFATDFATLLKVQANDLLVKAATPAITLEGTETSGVRYRWYENAGVLKLQYATIALPTTWHDILEQTAATGAMTITGDLTVSNDLTVTGDLNATLGDDSVIYGSIDWIDVGNSAVTTGGWSATTITESAPIVFSVPSGTLSGFVFGRVYITGETAGQWCEATVSTGMKISTAGTTQYVAYVRGRKSVSSTATVTVYLYIMSA